MEKCDYMAEGGFLIGIPGTVRQESSPLHRTNMGSKTLSSFMAGYKSIVTKQINGLRRLLGISVWQRNYYEHIIRDDMELNRIRQYIIENPLKWDRDSENPNNIIIRVNK